MCTVAPPARASVPADFPMSESPEHEEENAFIQLRQSLDRSRKRNLSEGLLRGDQVLDRLKAQEESASPCLTKKQKESETTPTKMAALTAGEFRDMMGKQDARLTRRFDALDGGLGGLKQSLNLLEGAVNANTAKLSDHEALIKGNQTRMGNFEAELKRIRDAPATTALPGERAPDPSSATKTDVEFDKARRSIRLWPVPGSAGPLVWQSTDLFLKHKLDLGDRVKENMIEHIHRPDLPSGPGVNDEAVVLFREIETRDMVMGASSKLAPFVDSSGRPTAGLRLEVPPHLRAAFRTLYKYGQSLRLRHGLGTRRHVKFDDLERSVYLNVKLPGDASWSRVSLDVAKRGLRARAIQSDGALERRFDITGEFVDRPRSTSLSQPPATPLQAAGQAPAWTGRRTESVSMD